MAEPELAFLAELVAAKSVSSKDPALDVSNKEASEAVASMLRGHGFDAELREVKGLAGKYNVESLLGPDEAGEGLLLAGHTDTVPYDAAAWASDPLELSVRDGRGYGMGACDMKAFFAAVAGALALVDLKSIKRPLRVWATANEECGMEGASQIVKDAPASRHALVGEPTALVPVYAHKGGMAEKIVCHGRAAHASDPSQGVSALEAMAKVMAALRTAHEASCAERADAIFTPPEATMNFGLCRAGAAFNTVPDHAELWVDRRLLPGEECAAVRKHLHEVARAAVADMEVKLEFSPLVAGFEPVLTPPEAPLIAYAAELTGQKPRTVPFGTEAPYYAGAGMDVLIMGAGSVADIHQPNESFPLAELEKMTAMTAKIIERFCCQ
ncbi:MAG: acetylornithine deacetylase [Betaproteobacteria bacterium AqS2]|uniref:Acetylornithine deacetylase n=1 Tax=Candidatus Amphirhobacter heronislandensis TaxID=1732024 RepID=A0A930UBP1_9GAMM|nr:acetylornithine deacetylase [Betaproteobacteria bacterium AqS2]